MKTAPSQNVTGMLHNASVKAWSYLENIHTVLQALVPKWEFKMSSHLWVMLSTRTEQA